MQSSSPQQPKAESTAPALLNCCLSRVKNKNNSALHSKAESTAPALLNCCLSRVKNTRGEMLLETVIGMLLFAILLLALSSAMVASSSTNQRILQNGQALQTAINTIKSQDYSQTEGNAQEQTIQFTYGTFTQPIPVLVPTQTQGLIGFQTATDTP